MNVIIKVIFTAILAVFVCTPETSFAQGAPKGNGEGKGPKIEERVQKMKTDLGLTDEQASQVKTALEEQHAKRKEGKDMTDEAARKANAQAAHKAFDEKMKTILTADQYTKFKAKQEEMRKKNGGKPAPGE